MMGTLDLFTDTRDEYAPEGQRLYWDGVGRATAFQLWREHSCAEFSDGRHDHMLEIEYGQAQIHCSICHHNPLDGDLDELLFFGPIPVDVDVRSIHHPGGPWGGDEYDVEIEVELR